MRRAPRATRQFLRETRHFAGARPRRCAARIANEPGARISTSERPPLTLEQYGPLPRDYLKRGSRLERSVMARPGFYFQRVDDAKRQSKLFRDMAQRRQF
jgi:hypothetical protein